MDASCLIKSVEFVLQTVMHTSPICFTIVAMAAIVYEYSSSSSAFTF
jgi:hypothetical protein